MASFTLQAFKAGVAPHTVDFADERSAYAETMRLQKSGTVDSVKLIRTKDQKVLFDTTKGVVPKIRPKRSKAPMLAVAAVALGAIIAFVLAFLKH
ncbi:MAG TPA: hypothetical protein VKQ29_01810 [Aliidongia sp.]|nr:hypothetical protein [Aliidongia sp.]